MNLFSDIYIKCIHPSNFGNCLSSTLFWWSWSPSQQTHEMLLQKKLTSIQWYKWDLNSDATLQIKVTTMGDLKNKWQQWSEQHIEGQKLNPFSEEFDHQHAMAVRLQKGDAGYGRPKEGSKTEERARRAEKHIHREMEEMCYIIRDMGARGQDGKVRVTFGRLFDRYVKISDKVVGILLRCRKHGMVCFEGEMLWQGQDDDVVITLLDWCRCLDPSGS